MAPHSAIGDTTHLLRWRRVREFAVPPSMIRTATARRESGDWAGACAAANVEVDLDLRGAAHRYGGELVGALRDDLRHLAPDLLRWHLPRVAPDGLIRPGLTIGLARYGSSRAPVQLVVRTPPAWADAGQRVSLALWDPGLREAGGHPHPRPSRRHRLDLHRHLWDARRAGELATRAGGEPRWAAEAAILLRADGLPDGPVAIRTGARRHLVLMGRQIAERRTVKGLPVLPDAAVRTPPDRDLLDAGLVTPDLLHPLVAAALAPGFRPTSAPRATRGADEPQLVDCRGATHRIGLVDGRLVPLDHDPVEIRREELLAALTGTPLPCLRLIEQAHRAPDCLEGVAERLRHGDTAGALAVVEALLGPAAVLRDGPLREELASAAERRIAYGMFRAGLAEPGRSRELLRRPDRRRGRRAPR
ncbi:hypothetical protein [Kitasatospora viridis]|uniref:Uncharacterized protein n=1 Tax=Kitasatospora viridis TaxID=281105 RepID=A0A561TSX8_9ACTN|nr:hypothetical protein [Kitasatospora viridis]TWF90200.1 hypothetical protein FHX73_13244 [Kitasatospora viridis]